jgi:diguanylate cyclase (GGDEF)-like protein/PAS domain S-box-containing protein
LCKDKTTVEVEGAVSTYVIGGRKYILTAMRDITERKEAEKALRESEHKLRTLLENMTEGLLQVNETDCIQFVNKSFCEMTGYSPEELIGKNWCDLLLNAESCETIEQVNLRRRRGVSDRYELKLRRKNGDVLWMLVGGAPIYSDSEKIGGSMGVFTDITERKRIEGQLLHDAFHDGLTNLANRALFMDHLQRAIERGKSRRSNLYAVLFLDFDRFKFINDSLGHLAGDEFLKSVARRLEAATRTSDIVARLGGDEFVVLLSELDTADEAVEIAERIQQHLKKSLKVFGRELFASASIGIALSTSHYENAEEMLRDADIAMYRAKARGRAGCQVFDRRMHEQAANQLLLETELRRALELGEFELHYQPIFSLDDNELVGFESLARWRHARRGVIQPTEFIPAAEESGLILPLGKWILEESCRQLREWQMTLRHTSHLTVSVNLSSKQFAQKDLAAQVAHALESSNLPPRCLKLEITESHVMENSEQAIETMKELRALGVELSLDDFGTGYSSLSYLHRLPASFLKIDRSFVSRMIESGEHREIVSTIIKLAKNLKMKTVAEGIETQEQLAHLNRLNCEFGQGYLFSKPLEAARARKFIEQAKSFFPFSKNAPVINLDVEF